MHVLWLVLPSLLFLLLVLGACVPKTASRVYVCVLFLTSLHSSSSFSFISLETMIATTAVYTIFRSTIHSHTCMHAHAHSHCLHIQYTVHGSQLTLSNQKDLYAYTYIRTQFHKVSKLATMCLRLIPPYRIAFFPYSTLRSQNT